jgi:FixJ family two-component response regulator
VLVAGDAMEAVEIMQKSGKDIGAIILDVTMPGMTAEEAFQRLKGIRPDVPVVLSTGHSETETAIRFAGAGLAGFLQKPYTASQLAEKIRTAMQPL